MRHPHVEMLVLIIAFRMKGTNLRSGSLIQTPATNQNLFLSVRCVLELLSATTGDCKRCSLPSCIACGVVTLCMHYCSSNAATGSQVLVQVTYFTGLWRSVSKL